MKIKKMLSVLLAAVVAVGSLALTAAADVKDTSKDVSLTIYVNEAADESEVALDSAVTGEPVDLSGKPVAGVSFLLYKTAADETSVTPPEGATAIVSGTTGEDGSVKIVLPAEQQGRYLVIMNEADKPEKVVGSTVPFLVDLPMTDPTGTCFMYDVYAYPKPLISHDTDTHTDEPEPVSDTESETPPPPVESDTESETPPPPVESDTESKTPPVESDTEEPPVESDLPEPVDSDLPEPVQSDSDLPEPVPEVPSPKVSKKVSDDNGATWQESVKINAAEGNRPYWKVSAEIPDNIDRMLVYKVGDILDNRLLPPSKNEVKASIGGKQLPESAYEIEISGQNVVVSFVPSAMVSYKGKTVDVLFPTAIDLTAPNSVGISIENIATLTFTKIGRGTNRDNDETDSDYSTDSRSSDTDASTPSVTTTTIVTSTVEVWTGEICGFKHNKNDEPLAGAEFGLYSDKDCKHEITTAVSDKDGKFWFRGILDGTYYVKELKAPTGYQANTNVIEAVVNTETKEPVQIDVLNIPKPNLPVTGGAGILGVTLIGLSISVLGGFVIILSLRLRRRELCASI